MRRSSEECEIGGPRATRARRSTLRGWVLAGLLGGAGLGAGCASSAVELARSGRLAEACQTLAQAGDEASEQERQAVRRAVLEGVALRARTRTLPAERIAARLGATPLEGARAQVVSFEVTGAQRPEVPVTALPLRRQGGQWWVPAQGAALWRLAGLTRPEGRPGKVEGDLRVAVDAATRVLTLGLFDPALRGPRPPAAELAKRRRQHLTEGLEALGRYACDVVPGRTCARVFAMAPVSRLETGGDGSTVALPTPAGVLDGAEVEALRLRVGAPDGCALVIDTTPDELAAFAAPAAPTPPAASPLVQGAHARLWVAPAARPPAEPGALWLDVEHTLTFPGDGYSSGLTLLVRADGVLWGPVKDRATDAARHALLGALADDASSRATLEAEELAIARLPPPPALALGAAGAGRATVAFARRQLSSGPDLVALQLWREGATSGAGVVPVAFTVPLQPGPDLASRLRATFAEGPRALTPAPQTLSDL